MITGVLPAAATPSGSVAQTTLPARPPVHHMRQAANLAQWPQDTHGPAQGHPEV